MRIRHFALMLLFVLISAAAEAQCLKCYRTGSPRQGICDWSDTGYRDRGCTEIGASCTLPDFIDPCDPWLLASSVSGGQRPAYSPQRYFTSRRMVEQSAAAMHRRLQGLDRSARRCGARI